jgi:hypothetical protein
MTPDGRGSKREEFVELVVTASDSSPCLVWALLRTAHDTPRLCPAYGERD